MENRRPGCCQNGFSSGIFIVLEMVITMSFNSGSTHLLKKPCLCFHWTCLSDDLCRAPVIQTLFRFTSFQCNQSWVNNSACRRAVTGVGQAPQISGPDTVFLAYRVMLVWFQVDSSMGLKCNSSFLAALCTKSSLSSKGAQRQGDLLGNDFTQIRAHLCSGVHQQVVVLLSIQTEASAY